MKTFLLYFLFFLASLGQAQSAEPVPVKVVDAAPASTPPALPPGLNAIVPYDPTLPIPKAAAHYFLDQATFQKLWAAAARARGDSAALPPDKALALSQAVYQIGLEKDYWLVKGRLSVFTAQPWAELGLNFPGATLTDVFIDDVAAAPVKSKLGFEKTGAHTVALTLRLPYDSSIGALNFQFPAAGATLAQVRAPLTAGLFAPESAQVPSTVAEENGQRLVTVALGHGTELTLQRQKAVAGAGAGAPAATTQASADLRQAVELHASWDRLKVEGTYHFPANFAGKLELDFPGDFVPVAVETPGAASWELRQEKGRQILSFRPTRSDSRECTVFLIVERQHAEAAAPKTDREAAAVAPAFPLPLATAGGARGTRTATIYEGRGLQVQPQPTAEHRRLPLPDEGATAPDARPVASFDYPPAAGPLPVIVGTARQKRRVQADYIFQVGRGKLEEIVTATFFAPGESFVTAAVGLPAGMVPQTVTGSELAEWSLSGERLFLRFQPGTRDGATVIIHTAKELAAAEADVVLQKADAAPIPDKTTPLPLQSLNFEGFPEVSGHGLLMAHAAEEVLFRAGKGILREEDPANSPVECTILPPFQKKQAFIFKRSSFEATVSLRRLDPQFTATWVLVAGVNESWTTLTYRVDLEIGRSALSGVRLLLPPGLNGVRVTGAEVREVRPVLEDKDHTALEVTFQHDLLDAVQLQVECDQPAAVAGAEAWLPGITVVGAEVGPTFLILDNLTNWEMSVKEEKTEAARSGDLPFVPAKLNNPRFYRALPGWKVAPSITKLVTTGGEKVLISQAELATFIRSNGDEWLRARYRILNRSLQFLPVKLPAGSEVISARVGGEAVRTEKAGDGAADILIPLIQTRPGEISYEVEVVLLRRGSGKLDAQLQRKMTDPKLPGLTVQHTLWEVHVPPGYTLEHTGGNMETVDEVESKAENSMPCFQRRTS